MREMRKTKAHNSLALFARAKRARREISLLLLAPVAGHAGLSLTPLSLPELSLRCVQGSYSFKVNSLVETEPLSVETSE